MMPKDIRHYAKFTLDFPDNPKILPLSDGAFRCLVEATIWSRFHQTDGFLPSRLASARWSLEILHELCNNHDDFPSLFEHPDGWIIHDYAEHQDTKAEIKARQEHAKAAGQRGGLAKAKRGAKRSAKQTPSGVLSKNVPEKEKEKEKDIRGEGYVSNAREPTAPDSNGAAAPPPCPKHPWGYNHDDPCRHCRTIREYDKAADARKAISNREADEAIRLCGRCDNRGYIGLTAGPFVKCPHNPQQIEELEQQNADAF